MSHGTFGHLVAHRGESGRFGILVLIFYIKILFPYAADQQSLFYDYADRLLSTLQHGAEILSGSEPEQEQAP